MKSSVLFVLCVSMLVWPKYVAVLIKSFNVEANYNSFLIVVGFYISFCMTLISWYMDAYAHVSIYHAGFA